MSVAIAIQLALVLLGVAIVATTKFPLRGLGIGFIFGGVMNTLFFLAIH